MMFNRKISRDMLRRMMMGLVLSLMVICAPSICGGVGSIVSSKHNLSVSGSGAMKAIAETEICIFCHTPHHAQPYGLLWNRKDPTMIYDTYESTTVQTSIGQPTGASRLCLSCHDGTIALGEVASRAVEIQMTQQYLNIGPAALTTDLSDDHPVSFVYDGSLSSTNDEYVDPSTLIDEVTLDKNNEMQCTSCHDPHDDSNGNFLKVYNSYSTLCLYCHQPTGWGASYHKLATSTWNGTLPDPWPHTEWTTVDANACESCHRPHSAGGKERLLNELVEEDNCLPCHNGNVAWSNMQNEFAKSSVHPISLTVGIHDPGEDPLSVGRHVECVDCHNPHQVNASQAVAPNVNGRLAGVSGWSTAAVFVENASFEYEVCYKCHADTAQGSPSVTRTIFEVNKRLQLDLNNPSYHPVEGPGKNLNVPSLLPPYTTNSVIYCTDCHNNNNGPGANGTGPSGPHGSQWNDLLERQYVMTDYTVESSETYALCYKCHNRISILNNESFKGHDLHIRQQSTPCSVCHDPHGISSTQGNSMNNSHLINFDSTVVLPVGANPQPIFVDDGILSGTCTLECHGYIHNPSSYTP